MQPTQEDVLAGQAIYTKPVLSLYDIVVLGLTNRFIWKCPTETLLQHYQTHISGNHLDVGVGSGYFLDNVKFPLSHPRVALMDLNPNTLQFASERIARYQPETWQQNVLEPVAQPIEPFDSLGINYLFHCVPGAIEEKAIAFEHLKPLLNSGATVFGSTILQGNTRRSLAAKGLMAHYNRKGIFSNKRDDLNGLRKALTQYFDEVMVHVEGCVALFSARHG